LLLTGPMLHCILRLDFLQHSGTEVVCLSEMVAPGCKRTSRPAIVGFANPFGCTDLNERASVREVGGPAGQPTVWRARTTMQRTAAGWSPCAKSRPSLVR